MNKKIVSFWILIISFFSIGFGYSLVFAGNLGSIEFVSSKNIFLDSLTLNKNKLIIKSRENLENVKIYGDCNVSGKLTNKNSQFYVFDIYFLDKNCNNSNVEVFFEKGDLRLSTIFNIYSDYNFYLDYLNYSDLKLEKHISDLSKGINVLSGFKTYNRDTHKNLFYFTEKNRRLLELEFMRNFLLDISNKRKQKYSIPVSKKVMTTIASKLPNAGRPYRADYTDGIHEGWDFDTNTGDSVYSLDFGVVIRVVDGFVWDDFNKIKRGSNLSVLDKKINLDILRGNQVWIKTMKGDIAFYSHLDEIFSNIKEGDIVRKGQPLGTVGTTGVPDRNYSDYHLHIEVRKNPYENKKIIYTFEDYMGWDWYFKGESKEYILNNQNNIFE